MVNDVYIVWYICTPSSKRYLKNMDVMMLSVNVFYSGHNLVSGALVYTC